MEVMYLFSLEYLGLDWEYRLPRPYAAVFLTGMGDRDDGVRSQSLMGYLDHVLSPGSSDQLWDLAFDEFVAFDVEELAGLIEEIQSRHSSRPFHVDVNLSATAVRNWPQVRGRLVMSGVGDPLKELPNIFGLIDAVEAMVLDGISDETERSKYFTRMYKPPVGSLSAKKNPKGWDASDEMAAFEDWENEE